MPPTLVVGAADDRAELEADRVAGEVIARMQGAEGGVHEHSAECGHGPVRRSAVDSAGAEVGFAGGALSADVSSRIAGKRGGGSSLPDDVRSRLEGGFGSSLADVRIHSDAESADLNRAVSARAFTAGKDIFFGAGEYQPDTPEGERVLAHEIAHTRQGGSGVGRIRRWKVLSSKFDMGDGIDVTTLKDRPIWFVKDQDDDWIVVKSENQPTGLSLLAAKMHKKLTRVKSVDQRTLTKADRDELARLIEIRSLSQAFDQSWTDRGTFLRANPDLQVDQTADAATVAKDDAVNELKTGGNPVIAMSWAEGDSAEKTAKPVEGEDKMSNDRSRYRKLLMDPNHVRLLGKMTAVDLFFGNTDRVVSGNGGNWFYNPSGEITLIDHVDPGGDLAGGGMKAGFSDNQVWINRVGTLLSERYESHSELAGGLFSVAKREGAGDDDITGWLNAKPDGGDSRRKMIKGWFFEGMDQELKHIIKVFSTTRWKGNAQKNKIKKSLRSMAKKAQREDNTTDDYYEVLKARVQWIRENLGLV